MGNDAAFYERDGLRYDRITRILDYFPHPALVDWKIDVGRKEARRISTVATKIGTNVDEVVKAEIEGSKPGKLKSEEAKNCYEAFRDWARSFSLKLKSSQTVFDSNLMVAGTPDLEDEDTVIDVKCSSEIRDSYWLQTEFYGRQLGKKYKAILRLDKNLGMYEYKKMPLNDEHWEAVRAAIKLYRFYNKSECDAPQTRKEVVSESSVDVANNAI